MTNNTVICHDSCSDGHGICMDHGTKCSCFFGYWGDVCEKGLDDYYPSAWLALRIIIGIVYFLLFFLGSLIIIRILRRGQLDKPKNRIALHVLGAFATYDLWTSIMYLVDPFGGELLPVAVNALYSSFSIFMGFYFLGSVLNYWIQVFHFTKTRLDKEQQLMKINSNYNPQVTIEDIENTLSKMNKWRLPYIIALGIVVAYQIPYILFTVLYDASYILWALGNLFLTLILYALFTIAFFVYEKRILSLIDKRETKEVHSVRSVSLRVRIFCIVTLVAVVVTAFYIFLFSDPLPTLVFKVISSIQQWCVTINIFTIYINLHPSQLRKTLFGLLTGSESDVTQTTMGSQSGAVAESGVDVTVEEAY